MSATREVVFLYTSTLGSGGQVRFVSRKRYASLFAEAYDEAQEELDASQGDRVRSLEQVK